MARRLRAMVGALAVLVAASAPAAAANWEMSVTEEGGLAASLRRTPVIEGHYVFWGASWKYAGATVTVGPMGAGGAPLSALVRALGLKFSGSVRSPAPNQLRYTWKIDSERQLTGIIGGGMEFNLTLDSPALGGEAGKPALLDGNTGWRWGVGGGQEVRAEFEKPIAKVYFERGNRAKIRCMFVGDTLAKGTHTFVMTVTLPAGGKVVKSPRDRYGPADTGKWFADVMAHDRSPVDLSFLNHTPAGSRGFVRADGDRLVFADGSEARFWGGNIAAYAIFADKKHIETQAKRIAQLGFNLMRIHHHDSMRWVSRTVIDKKRDDSQHLDEEVMDRLDWWIKCLRDEGVYVWLDLHVGRLVKEGDRIGEGWAEMIRRSRGAAGSEVKGYCYFNERIEQLMKDFNARYLSHVNKYTKLAYKDDPAIMGLLITNENDITHHFGNLMLPDKNNPYHNKRFTAAVQAFAAKHGLKYAETWKTWVAGPSKLFLADWEHAWNGRMLAHLKALGVKVPVATTQMWGGMPLSGLPPLTAGGIIDVHSYGPTEALGANPRYKDNYVSYFVTGQAFGKPVAITEWNVPYPKADRFTAPLYVASICALQGIDAPMIYNYSQRAFGKPTRPSTWSSFPDPALTGLMPAAAMLFRQGHVSPARKTYCIKLDRQTLYYQSGHPRNMAALRTLVEQSKVTLGLPDVKELDWDAETKPPAGVTVVADVKKDFIPAGQDFVRSDTGQLTRNWVTGFQTIDTPRTQAAHGWIGGQTLKLTDVTVKITTPKAAVAVTALDGKPIAASQRVLITAVARVVASKGNRMPLLSEPVVGELILRAPAGLTLVGLKPDGKETAPRPAEYASGAYRIDLTREAGTQWLLLRPTR